MAHRMTTFSGLKHFLFPKAPSSAAQAKERLKLILEYEGSQNNREKLDFLPKLKQELLEVIGKYGEVDLDKVEVRFDRNQDRPVLEVEVNLALPG
jgi:cell division topological specificity factor